MWWGRTASTELDSYKASSSWMFLEFTQQALMTLSTSQRAVPLIRMEMIHCMNISLTRCFEHLWRRTEVTSLCYCKCEVSQSSAGLQSYTAVFLCGFIDSLLRIFQLDSTVHYFFILKRWYAQLHWRCMNKTHNATFVFGQSTCSWASLLWTK